jgi:hypothetical protein
MYVQEKKDPDQQWLPTQYRLMEEEMGNIMLDWDDEWKIPPTETEPSTQPNQKYMMLMRRKKKKMTRTKGRAQRSQCHSQHHTMIEREKSQRQGDPETMAQAQSH